MTAAAFVAKALPRAAMAAALLLPPLAMSGCSSMSDSVLTEAFADPAKYDLYDCKQLEAERKSLASRATDLQRLMEKADTGVAGPVVAELAYRNDYIAVRGQMRFADEAWRKNRCRETPPAEAVPAALTPPNIKPAPPSRAGRAAN
jgi:hypothetical protein